MNQKVVHASEQNTRNSWIWLSFIIIKSMIDNFGRFIFVGRTENNTADTSNFIG